MPNGRFKDEPKGPCHTRQRLQTTAVHAIHDHFDGTAEHFQSLSYDHQEENVNIRMNAFSLLQCTMVAKSSTQVTGPNALR